MDKFTRNMFGGYDTTTLKNQLTGAPMNRQELLTRQTEIQKELQELETKLKLTETSFVDIDGDEIRVVANSLGEIQLESFMGEDEGILYTPTENIHDLIRILTNFATQNNL